MGKNNQPGVAALNVKGNWVEQSTKTSKERLSAIAAEHFIISQFPIIKKISYEFSISVKDGNHYVGCRWVTMGITETYELIS